MCGKTVGLVLLVDALDPVADVADEHDFGDLGRVVDGEAELEGQMLVDGHAPHVLLTRAEHIAGRVLEVAVHLHAQIGAVRRGNLALDLHAAVGDKRELAEQSVEYGLQQLDETLKAVEASSANPVEALIRTAVTACDAFGQMSWMFSEDAPYYPAVVDAIELERQKLQEQQHTIFRQGVEQGYLLGEAYYELFEQLFWQNVTAGTRHREVTLRVLFTVVRGSATEQGRQEAERVREAMGVAG